MKKTILTVLVWLSAIIAYAQSPVVVQDEVIVLDTDLEETVDYQFFAGDSIVLNPGFRRLSHSSLHHVFNTELVVDDYAIFPPSQGEQGGPNEGDQGYVGALGGSVDVGAIGGAFYSIPIELPAGINGMQPSLALTYNSQGGNGLLGWKWDLAGLSSITRTGKTLYHDGAIGGVSLDDGNDRFLLDGQRLMAVASYGDSIEYKLEQDDMSRIMAYKVTEELYGHHCTYNVIDKFRIWKADGTVLEYGFTEDSRINPQSGIMMAMCWLLNKVSDRNGNSIGYYYTEIQQTGEYYIDSIQYTSNGRLSIAPEFTVRFGYKDKKDYEFGYIAGNIVQQKRLLTSISIAKRDHGELTRYTMDYSETTTYAMSSYRSNRMYHRLTGIFLEKEGKTLNPTRIIWERDETSAYQYNDSYKSELDTTYLNNFIFVGDFNADGFSDILTVPYKGKGSATYPDPVDMNVLLNQGDGSFCLSPSLSMNTANGSPLATNLDWIHVIDINDDGFDDIILHYYNKDELEPFNSTTSLALYINQSGERFATAWNTPLESPLKLYLTFGDFLGEGKQSSMAFFLDDLVDTIPVMVPLFYIHCENNISIYDTISNLEAFIANDVVAGDFTGDGKTETMIVNQNHGWMYRLRHNDGRYSFDPMHSCPEIKYVPELNLFPGDYNGDGKTDLLCYGRHGEAEQLEWFFLYSKGTSFDYQATSSFLGLSFSPPEKLYTYSLEKVEVGGGFAMFASDFDGDGLCDVAQSCWINGEHAIRVYSKFVPCVIKRLNQNNYYEYLGGYNSLANATISGIRTRSQYLHVGNFHNKDNMSFLGNEVPESDKVQQKKPVLCSLYSLHEYNSVTCVTDGLGNETRMSYRYPAIAGMRRTELGNGICSINMPVRTLHSVTEYKIHDVANTTFYSFGKALLHQDGHGYLGFQRQETLEKVNDIPVSKNVTNFETRTMGSHAFSLPENETAQVYFDGSWRTLMERGYEFRKVTCTRNQKVVKPAVIELSSIYYNYDTPNPNDLLRREIIDYDYSFGTGNTYNNTYNCTETRTGIDANEVTSYSQCEFKTVETVEFYGNDYDTWTINRPHRKIVTQKRDGKPDVSRRWTYEYTAPDSYLVSRLYDNPMCVDQNPLMTRTDFEYHEEGNLKKKTIKVPNGTLGEQDRMEKYEYGPGEGAESQRRLVTKKVTLSGDLQYETNYAYDNYDNLDTLVGSNGLVTAYETDPLGTKAKSIGPDQLQTCTALRWVEEGDPYAPRDASYLKWSRSSGNQKTLTYYHKTGVELRTVSFGLDGEAIFADKTYDDRGRLGKVFNPYHLGDALQETSYQYDNLDRPVSVITPDGTETATDYVGNQVTTVVTPTAGQPQSSTVTTNAMGWTVRSDDASGNSYVTYDHYADGLLAEAKVNNDATTAITSTYDNARNRLTLTDPNYGTLTTTYNAYGELRKRVSPKELADGNETHYQYDGLGRLKVEMCDMESTYTRYTYNEADGPAKGTLAEVLHHTYDYHPIQRINYDYDNLGRNIKTVETRPSGAYETRTSYDEYSRVCQTVFPTGVTVNYEYRNGYLQTIKDECNNVLWRTDKANAYGQLVDATLGNGTTTHRAYKEDMHYIDSIVTSNNLQNLSYGYDKFGNFEARKDNLRNLEETFHYDKMNRLTDIYLGNTHSQIVYDPLGRMTTKQADGQTVFANASFAAAQGQPASPHAMKSAETAEGVFPSAPQEITYTGFDKVKTIAEGGNTLAYTYGYDQQRIRMMENIGDITRTKDYVGVCEYIAEDDGENTTEKTLTYLVGPYGVFAVVEQQDNEEAIHYILKDHLGSWTTITDSEGNVEQELSFDAWGNLRDPETWSGSYSGTPMFDRGFTGHEHMTAFGLINMNGRCYDPLTSSFLSVDAYVQDPTTAQAFNRYAYCGYNPLRYTDPTGWYADGYGRQPQPQCYDPTARYHSDDPNDVLWGRSVHPCGNSSSGYVNGTAVTSTGYTEGNGTSQNTTSSGITPKPIKTEEGYYLNIFTGKIEYNSGGENLLYDKGLMFMASPDATFGDIYDIINNWGLKSGYDAEGIYYITDSYVKGWNLWHAMPAMATFFAGMTVESFISAIAQLKFAKFYTIDSKKYDYFFGKVTSNSHNATRSIQIKNTLNELGITNKHQMNRIFDRAITEGNIIKTQTTNYGTVITRQVEIGKTGCIDVGFFYENSNMLSIPKVVTVIPKIY